MTKAGFQNTYLSISEGNPTLLYRFDRMLVGPCRKLLLSKSDISSLTAPQAGYLES